MKHLKSLLFIIIFPAIALSQGWNSASLNYPSTVWTLAAYNNNIQAGGVFSTPNEIRTMLVYNGDLYSGGSSSGAGTPIYKNGVSIGTTNGGSNVVFAMTVFNNELYVAGSFTSINSVAANNIARWNGATWQAVGTGVGNTSSIIYSLAVLNTDLFAGGLGLNTLYKWNASSWTTIGTFNSGSLIRALTAYNGSLFAGGFFSSVSSVNAVNLVRLLNTTWLAVGNIGVDGDISDGVSALQVHNNELYCAGNFSVAGSTSMENIGKWAGGITWEALGTGTSGTINTLLSYNQSLYVGGNFNSAGGISVGNIAKWTPCTVSISPPNTASTCTGGSVVLTATAGTAYQWKKDNVNIAGANNITYTATTPGYYNCVITTPCGNILTNQTYVYVWNPNSAPIDTGFSSTTFCSGSITLHAPVFSNTAYQWYENNTEIPGANSDFYEATGSGNYFCKLFPPSVNAGQCGYSFNTNVLTINGPPTIISQTPLTFCAGGSVQLNVISTSFASGYQWKLNGVNISGANSSTYTATVSGNYSCALTNTLCGNTISNTVTVTAGGTPGITLIHPGRLIGGSESLDICGPGGFFSVFPSNAGTYTLYDASNFQAVASQTSHQFFNTPTGNYYVELNNGCGTSVAPNSSYIKIRNISTRNRVVSANGSTSTCSGSLTLLLQPSYAISWAPLGFVWDSYNWKVNGVSIPTPLIPEQLTPTQTGWYSCTISNSCGAALTQDSLYINVGPPTATISPAGTVNICTGGSQLLTANSGIGYTYQWKRNGSLLTTTSSTLVASLAGSYTVVITNSCGSATSAVTVVNIGTPPPSTITPAGPTTVCSGSVVLSSTLGS